MLDDETYENLGWLWTATPPSNVAERWIAIGAGEDPVECGCAGYTTIEGLDVVVVIEDAAMGCAVREKMLECGIEVRVVG